MSKSETTGHLAVKKSKKIYIQGTLLKKIAQLSETITNMKEMMCYVSKWGDTLKNFIIKIYVFF